MADFRTETVLWTVEWVVTFATETKTILQHRLDTLCTLLTIRVPDTTTLRDAFRGNKVAVGGDTQFLIRKAVQPVGLIIVFLT